MCYAETSTYSKRFYDMTTMTDVPYLLFLSMCNEFSSIFQLCQFVMVRHEWMNETKLSSDTDVLIKPTIYSNAHVFFLWIGKLPECTAGPRHTGDSAPLPELDSFRLHLRDQAHQHSGLQGKAEHIHSDEHKWGLDMCIVFWISVIGMWSWWSTNTK